MRPGRSGCRRSQGLGASGMAQYQALFNERAALAAAASSAGSGQAYGAQIAVLQAEVNRLTVVAKQAERPWRWPRVCEGVQGG